MDNVYIGITTSFNEGEQRLEHTYVRAVEAAGGVPMPVPMVDEPSTLEAFVRLLDGLIITGGPAIEDGLIGDLPDEISPTEGIRSASDRQVLQAFLDAQKPVLGICYGMQLLNAMHGGTIYADVERQQDGALVHSSTRGGTTHAIHLDEQSLLRRLLGRDSVTVNTRHLQAVAVVPAPFSVVATAPDGVVEGIETDDGRLIGVQFHPERMPDTMAPLFNHLMQQARRRKAAG